MLSPNSSVCSPRSVFSHLTQHLAQSQHLLPQVVILLRHVYCGFYDFYSVLKSGADHERDTLDIGTVVASLYIVCHHLQVDNIRQEYIVYVFLNEVLYVSVGHFDRVAHLSQDQLQPLVDKLPVCFIGNHYF